LYGKEGGVVERWMVGGGSKKRRSGEIRCEVRGREGISREKTPSFKIGSELVLGRGLR